MPSTMEVRELFFPTSSQHDAYVEIRRILQQARESVTVVDPYIDRSIFLLLGAYEMPVTSVRVLTYKYPGDFFARDHQVSGSTSESQDRDAHHQGISRSIDPIIRALGYQKEAYFSLAREKHLKVLDKDLFIDYSMTLWSQNFRLFEAKKVQRKRMAFSHNDLNQALQYATHPEINAALVVLCDGRIIDVYDREVSVVDRVLRVRSRSVERGIRQAEGAARDPLTRQGIRSGNQHEPP